MASINLPTLSHGHKKPDRKKRLFKRAGLPVISCMVRPISSLVGQTLMQ
jgi:hypothetical protein